MSLVGWLYASAGALLLLELLTLDLTLLMLAAGAAVAAACLQAGLPLFGAALIGAAVAILCLGFVRPLALRLLRRGTGLTTGTDALLGASGLVVERIGSEGGLIKLRGETWTARSHDGSTIEAGVGVDVVAIEGATAVVVGK